MAEPPRQECAGTPRTEGAKEASSAVEQHRVLPLGSQSHGYDMFNDLSLDARSTATLSAHANFSLELTALNALSIFDLVSRGDACDPLVKLRRKGGHCETLCQFGFDDITSRAIG